MKRQLGSAPQPHLSIQNELALYKEVEDLKSTITTLRSHIAMLTSAKHTLTHENMQIVNEKSQLLSSIHTLESTLKMEMGKNSDLEVVNKSLINKNDLLIKNKDSLSQEKDVAIKYHITAYDDLLDDISCQEELFGAMATEVILTGDIT